MQDGHLDRTGRAEGALLGNPSRVYHRRVVQLHVADLQPARRIGREPSSDVVGLRERERERLLGEHREARLEPGRHRGSVRTGGQDEQPVELGALETSSTVPKRRSAATWYRSPMAAVSVGERSAIAAISNVSRSRSMSGRWTACATAPSPAIPRRTRREGEPASGWDVMSAEYIERPVP